MRAPATATVEVILLAVYDGKGSVAVSTWLAREAAKEWVNELGGGLFGPGELASMVLPAVVQAYNDMVADAIVVKTVKLDVPVAGPIVAVYRP